MAIAFPAVSKIAFSIGPLQIRWYSLAYLFGILYSWVMMRRYASNHKTNLTPKLVDDFISWGIMAIILGGRLGYVLFYNIGYYIENPLKIIAVWDGGMSFHGALIGFVITVLIFCRKYKINPLYFGDMICVTAPVGLFLGRVANFINAELYGRKAPDFEYAVIFPYTDGTPRHASQLYEAGLEGILLFLILNILWLVPSLRLRHGFFVGMFCAFYAIFRFVVEFFREPDFQLGFIINEFTMGQILCLPMFIFGVWLIIHSFKRGKNA